MPSGPASAPGRADLVGRLRAAGCVFAEEEAGLLAESGATPTALRAMVERRVRGEPLEHVLGWADFCGLRIEVARGVFVPRRRTELLARRAASLAPPRATVVDLACGSGAVAAAVAAQANVGALHATDIEAVAVRCARRNLAPLRGQVHAGDLYEPLPVRLRGRVDVLVANAPYVPTGSIRLMPAEARIHEPPAALDGGSDGLDVVRRVVSAAPGWLAAGGHLLVETAASQAAAAFELFATAGLDPAVISDAGLDATVVVGRRQPAPPSRTSSASTIRYA